MTIFRRLAATLAACAVAIGAALSLASPAQAAPPASCPNSSMCAYNDNQYNTAGGYEIAPVQPNGVCEGVAFNDQISSIWNGSGKTVRFFMNAGCSGSSFTVTNGSGVLSLGMSHPTFSNKISSYRWNG